MHGMVVDHSVVPEAQIASGGLIDFIHVLEPDRHGQSKQPIDDLKTFVLLRWPIEGGLTEILSRHAV
jgi:hypothetical protein